jgi:hypothetical protein
MNSLVSTRTTLEAFKGAWGQRPNPPTVAIATGLARPEFLVEMDAVAVVPE